MRCLNIGHIVTGRLCRLGLARGCPWASLGRLRPPIAHGSCCVILAPLAVINAANCIDLAHCVTFEVFLLQTLHFILKNSIHCCTHSQRWRHGLPPWLNRLKVSGKLQRCHDAKSGARQGVQRLQKLTRGLLQLKRVELRALASMDRTILTKVVRTLSSGTPLRACRRAADSARHSAGASDGCETDSRRVPICAGARPQHSGVMPHRAGARQRAQEPVRVCWNHRSS